MHEKDKKLVSLIQESIFGFGKPKVNSVTLHYSVASDGQSKGDSVGYTKVDRKDGEDDNSFATRIKHHVDHFHKSREMTQTHSSNTSDTGAIKSHLSGKGEHHVGTTNNNAHTNSGPVDSTHYHTHMEVH